MLKTACLRLVLITMVVLFVFIKQTRAQDESEISSTMDTKILFFGPVKDTSNMN